MQFSKRGYIWTPTRREALKTMGGAIGVGLLAPRVARAAGWARGTGSPNQVSAPVVSGGVPFTSTAIDTTGCDFLVVSISWAVSVPSFTDSKGNTWNRLTQSGSGRICVLYWSRPTTVGAGHTITVTNGSNPFAVITFAGFSGSVASPFDNEASATGTSPFGPTLTPTGANELVITAVSGTGGSSPAPAVSGGGMTLISSIANGGDAVGGMGYVIQTAAVACSPTWTLASAATGASVIASFKGAAVATPIRHRVTSGGE